MKRALFVMATGGVALGSVLSACSSDGAAPLAFDDTDANVADAAPAQTPDAASSDSAATDAGILDARPPFDAATPPVECAVTPCMTRIVAGPAHFCAIATDGKVRCWGLGDAIGELAATTDGSEPGATPVLIDGIDGAVDIAADSLTTCVATSAGAVACFGFRLSGVTVMPEVVDAKKVAIGSDRLCAVRASGELHCWGDSWLYGAGEAAMDLSGGAAASVVVGSTVAFTIASSGALFSWGQGSDILGRTTPYFVDLTPAPVESVPTMLQVAVSDRDACAIAQDGRLFCWGDGTGGGLGLGYLRDVSTPTVVPLPGPAYPSRVAVSYSHSCARMSDGSLDCWAAANTKGELGYESKVGVFLPTKVKLDEEVLDVATSNGSTCAISKSGRVQCWGANDSGQLGIGASDVDRHWVPTTVLFPR